MISSYRFFSKKSHLRGLLNDGANDVNYYSGWAKNINVFNKELHIIARFKLKSWKQS